MSGETPGSSLAVGSLVLTSTVNSGVTISRPVVTSGRVPTAGNTVSGNSSASLAAVYQNLASQLLGQAANTAPQRRVSNIVPSSQSSSHNATRHSSPCTSHTFRVRVINPDCKKQYDTYMLRNVSRESISSPLDLKKKMLEQFGRETVAAELDFSVGYLKGNSKVSIISSVDVDDVWAAVEKGESVCLWCEKVRKVSKRRASDVDSTTDSEGTSDGDRQSVRKTKKKKRKKKRRKLSLMEEKNERIEETISSLREKHGDKFTVIQYRMWSELIDNGKHRSLDDPPAIPAFSGRTEKRVTPLTGLTTAVAEMARAISQQHSPCTHPSPSPTSSEPSVGISPGKKATLRSNYLQQMRDLHSLYANGALTEDEFLDQKMPILEQLKKLS